MINVMSANIRFSNPKDGNHDWPNRAPIVATLINDKKIDLLATQEGRKPQLNDLEHRLSHLTLIDEHRSWITERMYPCIFINPEKFDVIKSEDIWLSETPNIAGSKSFESAFPRLCTYAWLKEKSSQQEFIFINCHLDHLEELTRIKQVEVLAKEISKRVPTQTALIFCGDFNAGPQTQVRKSLIHDFPYLIDPWLKQGLSEQTSFHNFDGLDPLKRSLRIDWILHTPNLACKYIEMITDKFDGLYPSDHFFIHARLTVSNS